MEPTTVVLLLELWFGTTAKTVNTFDPQPKMVKAGETIEQTIEREEKELGQ